MTTDQYTYEYKLPERFNADTPRSLFTELQDLPSTSWKRIVLDMSETTTIDSSGIGVLVYLYKELTARQKSLVLKKPHRNIFNLLMETGIDRLFDVELSSGVKKAETVGLEGIGDQLHMSEEMVGDVCVVTLSGVMNYPTGSMHFKKQMFVVVASSNKVLLDMTDLLFFDGLSMGSVLRVSRFLMENGGSIRACGASFIVRGVFESMGVDALIKFYDTREAALAHWD